MTYRNCWADERQ